MLSPLCSATRASVKPRARRQRRISRPTGSRRPSVLVRPSSTLLPCPGVRSISARYDLSMPEPGYPNGDALVPERFDEHTVIFLVRPPDAPQFSEEELDRLQVEHLTYLRDLMRRGVLIANGPLTDQ